MTGYSLVSVCQFGPANLSRTFQKSSAHVCWPSMKIKRNDKDKYNSWLAYVLNHYITKVMIDALWSNLKIHLKQVRFQRNLGIITVNLLRNSNTPIYWINSRKATFVLPVWFLWQEKIWVCTCSPKMTPTKEPSIECFKGNPFMQWRMCNTKTQRKHIG